jgi:SAM-dependent methyltransferase
MDWTAGYTADIEYIAGFFRELSPTYLNFVCVVNGFQPVRTDRPYTYCELGCGRGLTVNVLAATNPRAHFYGIDFNPAHISGARYLAETARLSNVTLLENSFEELVDGKSRDLPPFDFIVLHGVYAWVRPESRQHVRRFIGEYLKPGGIVYVSYNTMPGWAPMAPLQRLVREIASLRAGSSEGRLSEARDVVNRMVELQALYLTGNSAIVPRLEELASGHAQYLAHEYLNEQSEPHYHADVARQLFDEAKLQFVGSADLPLAMPSIYLKPEARDLLKTVNDAATAETIKDYFLNTAFRKDVYVRGARAINQQHQTDALSRFGLALCIPREQVTLKMKLSFGEIAAREEVHGPILDALASRPHGIAELAALSALKNKPIGQVVLAAALLIASMQAAIYPMDASPESSETSRALNLTLADQFRYGEDFQVLASPLLTSGIPVTLVGSLVYRLLAGNEPVGDTNVIAQRVWQTMSSAGRHLEKDHKKIEGDEANLAETKRLVEQVMAQRLPLWRQLGIM